MPNLEPQNTQSHNKKNVILKAEDRQPEPEERLEKVLELIKNIKDVHRRIELIYITLGVVVDESEVFISCPEKIVAGIIRSRMPKTCPKCRGECIDKNLKPCDFCEGHGEVSAVKEENFFLNR